MLQKKKVDNHPPPPSRGGGLSIFCFKTISGPHVYKSKGNRMHNSEFTLQLNCALDNPAFFTHGVWNTFFLVVVYTYMKAYLFFTMFFIYIYTYIYIYSIGIYKLMYIYIYIYIYKYITMYTHPMYATRRYSISAR